MTSLNYPIKTIKDQWGRSFDVYVVGDKLYDAAISDLNGELTGEVKPLQFPDPATDFTEAQ